MAQDSTQQVGDVRKLYFPRRLNVALHHGADGSGVMTDLPHELRTLLAIITLLTGNLDRLYEQLAEEDRRTMIRKLRQHTKKLNELVGDVLALCDDTGPFPQ